MKGNDHKCSLDIEEFAEMVRSIRIMESAVGTSIKTFQKCEDDCFKKLGKCLVALKRISKGNVITVEDLCIKVTFYIA
jgi:sialic acid synthase SpsE